MTPAFFARATLGFREATFFLPEVRDTVFLLAAAFLPEVFLCAVPRERWDVERRRAPALRVLVFFRLDERVAFFLPLLELRRDDFLAAAMIQLRGKMFR